MLDLVGKRYWFYLISLLVLIPGIISLGLFGIRLGVEFSSGTTMTLHFEQEVPQADLRQALAELGHGEAIIQRTGEDYFVRTTRLAREQKDDQGNIIAPAEIDTLKKGLGERFGSVKLLDFFDVSPVVAGETTRNAAIAVAVASVGIVLYIAWAFRKTARSFRFGLCAIVPLLHDVLLVLGIFSILGRFFKMEVNAAFIMAILTVIGYSVNDKVVVFDRIRENQLRHPNEDFATVVNNSLVGTLARSLNTGMATLFVLAALLLFGGATIRDFVLAMFIGIISGTYSSIFNASQLIVSWEYDDFGRLWRKTPFGRLRATPPRAS